MFGVRKSKFRHVFGQALRKDHCYDNIRITKSSLDSTFCSANPKYVAIITEAAGGGAFLVLPISRTGRIERDHPLVSGHKAAVLDIEWCPHNDDIIASGSEDTTVKVWQIPEGGLVTNLTEPIVSLAGHQRRVSLIRWHPTAQNILLSVGADMKLLIWNVGTEEIFVEIELPELCISASFNSDGSKLATTCKDKQIRVFNARTGEMLSESKGHDGAKPSMCAYLQDGKIFTTGFSRMSARQYALWDENDMSKHMLMEDIDNSNGVIFPFYDADTNMIYLCGKGDSIIRYYEVTEEAPYVHFLDLFQSKDAQRGVGFMPKRGLDVNHNEIARIYKLLNSGLCQVIPFTVPRKSELFQTDLYPDTAGIAPAVTAEEWLEGKKSSAPILVSLQTGCESEKKKEPVVIRKANVLDTPKKVQSQPTPQPPPQQQQQPKPPVHHEPAPAPKSEPAPRSEPAPAHAPVSQSHTTSNDRSSVVEPAPAASGAALPPDFDAAQVLKDMAELRGLVKGQDKKIAELERRLSDFEGGVRDLANDEEN